MIPAIEKDFPVLPYVIDGIRRHVMHPIGDIHIVAPDSTFIKALCDEKQCKFIDETTVLPVNKKEIHGGGWIFQQLLKLSSDTICSNNHYLVVDADTIFIAPHYFIYENKSIFYCHDFFWDYKPLFEHFNRLTGLKAIAPRSLITHYMFFSKTGLHELKKWIESVHDKPWYQAILDTIDKRVAVLPFSEFETYGNFALIKFPGHFAFTRAKNLEYKSSDFDGFHQLDIEELGKKYNSISYHYRNS